MACIDPHQTGFVGKGGDHLQLIKFWPSRIPGKGVCGGAKNFGSALLQPARSVCVSLSAFSCLFTKYGRQLNRKHKNTKKNLLIACNGPAISQLESVTFCI